MGEGKEELIRGLSMIYAKVAEILCAVETEVRRGIISAFIQSFAELETKLTEKENGQSYH